MFRKDKQCVFVAGYTLLYPSKPPAVCLYLSIRQYTSSQIVTSRSKPVEESFAIGSCLESNHEAVQFRISLQELLVRYDKRHIYH